MGTLLRFVATAAVLVGLAAVACGGGGDRGDLLVEGDGSSERRSAEEIAADNVVRAAPTGGCVACRSRTWVACPYSRGA